MGIINFIDSILTDNKYRVNKTNPGFLMFSTIKYYYNVYGLSIYIIYQR